MLGVRPLSCRNWQAISNQDFDSFQASDADVCKSTWVISRGSPDILNKSAGSHLQPQQTSDLAVFNLPPVWVIGPPLSATLSLGNGPPMLSVASMSMGKEGLLHLDTCLTQIHPAVTRLCLKLVPTSRLPPFSRPATSHCKLLQMIR